jgi:hypothetical protein
MFLTFAARRKFALVKKTICCLITLTFVMSLPGSGSAQLASLLPVPGTAVTISPVFIAPTLKGLNVHPENPFLFDFIVGCGDDKIQGPALKAESEKLVKFFLTAMTIPDKEAWVNLSPYEFNRIIPEALGKTEMGKVMLEQDYLLKQLASSLTNPETDLGKKFWTNVRAKVQEQFGTTDIPMSTFNKVWIVPAKAEVAEKDGKVFITQNRLKVMLEEDLDAMQKTLDAGRSTLEKTTSVKSLTSDITALSSQVFRATILPSIEKEINEGKNFAAVRQIYDAAILAVWYKSALKESLLGKIYADKSKVKGIETDAVGFKQDVYNQYVQAFKKGAYNMIKEDFDMNTAESVPTRYFSGGVVLPNVVAIDENGVAASAVNSDDADVKVQMGEANGKDITAIVNNVAASAVTKKTQDIHYLRNVVSGFKGVALAALGNKYASGTENRYNIVRGALERNPNLLMENDRPLSNQPEDVYRWLLDREILAQMITKHNDIQNVFRSKVNAEIRKMSPDLPTAQVKTQAENIVLKSYAPAIQRALKYLPQIIDQMTKMPDEPETIGLKLDKAVDKLIADIIATAVSSSAVTDLVKAAQSLRVVFDSMTLDLKALKEDQPLQYQEAKKKLINDLISSNDGADLLLVTNRLIRDSQSDSDPFIIVKANLAALRDGNGSDTTRSEIIQALSQQNVLDQVQFYVVSATSASSALTSGQLISVLEDIRHNAGVIRNSSEEPGKLRDSMDRIYQYEIEKAQQPANAYDPPRQNFLIFYREMKPLMERFENQGKSRGDAYLEALGILFSQINNVSASSALIVQSFNDWLADYAKESKKDLLSLQVELEKDGKRNAALRLRWAALQDKNADDKLQKLQAKATTSPEVLRAAQNIKNQTTVVLTNARVAFGEVYGFSGRSKSIGASDIMPILRDEVANFNTRADQLLTGDSLAFNPIVELQEKIKTLLRELEAEQDLYSGNQKVGEDDLRVFEIYMLIEEGTRLLDRTADALEDVPLEVADANAEADSNGVASSAAQVGGINFDPTLMNLQVKRDKNGVPLPVFQQDLPNINIEGLYPVIINIAPVTMANFPLLSKAEEQEQKKAAFKAQLSPADRQKAIRKGDILAQKS